MSDPNAKRITDLQELTQSDLENPDLIEVVNKNGDPNGNPKSSSVPLNELGNFININQGFDLFDQATFSKEDLASDDAVEFNQNGDVERNSGLVILQTDEEVSSTDYKGELAVFLWSHNSNTGTASTSLWVSTDSIFAATTGGLTGATGNTGEITFSVGSVTDNKPPLYVENRRANLINVRLHTL